jgi:hypothetical protein
MGIGLGIGINRSNYAQGIFNAYNSRVVADGGVTEAAGCVDAVTGLLLTASLLLIPSGYKSGKAYAQIPTNGNGDLTWTRASTALRTNSSGNIELMASGVPRLSYMYGSCPALLLEPQRTNLLFPSEDLTNANWVKTNVTASANSIVAPDGNTTADTLTATASTGQHQVQNGAHTATTVTASIYAKKGTNNFLQIFSGTSSQAFANFNLDSGVVGTLGSLATSSIQNVGNGWYRCIMTFTAASGSTFRWALVSSASAGYGQSWTTTGSENLYLWGAQVEVGAYPTTYIPTTTASATRVADSFSRNNIYTNGLITSAGGTWFVELRNNIAYVRDSSSQGINIGDSSTTISNGLLILNIGTGRQVVQKIISGTATTLYTTLTDTTKIAIKWNGTSADVFVNGTKQVTATSYTTTLMEFLNGNASGIPRFIQAMALYPTPLSDTDCTTLTTL